MKKMASVSFIFVCMLLLGDTDRLFADDPLTSETLIVHEWGTITTIHSKDGPPFGRLNKISENEVLPEFVHQYEPPETRASPDGQFTKGTGISGHPDVTMRLETPVIYFYPPPSFATNTFDVLVKFRGGLLNEYYPNASPSFKLDEEHIDRKRQAGVPWNGRRLENYIVGRLEWKNMTFSKEKLGPKTDAKVWLAPRKASKAASVVEAKGEGERYLFYRGVAHLTAPFSTKHDAKEIRFFNPTGYFATFKNIKIPEIWIMESKEDGTVAFSSHGALVVNSGNNKQLSRAPLVFKGSDFNAGNLSKLRSLMFKALVTQGLFEEEADAMLDTWEESYYKKPGKRVFYIVPNEWIDYYLPVTISVPNKMTRVFVGKVEL